jgi:polyhydroxyalkanoate synthase
MSTLPVKVTPESALNELMEFNRKLLRGMEILGTISDDDTLVGATPKHAVYREDGITLYRYEPAASELHPVPLLISYALVNRPYMVDLQADRSIVRGLLDKGIDVYLIDWGYPTRADRWLTLDDYINGYLNSCVEAVQARNELDRINLLGICQGGAFAACYAALHPERIRNLITMVTPVDFDVPDGLLNTWAGCEAGAEAMDADLMVKALGNIPGDFMNFGFLLLRPFALGLGKYTDLVDILDDREKLINFLRMERWIFDSPDQAGEAWRQFIRDFYQQNKLIKGEVEIGGARVDLSRITMPVLNIYGTEDTLVPPASSMALSEYVGTKDYTAKSFPVGHIGMYVSGKVQRDLPPLIAGWLKDR